MVEVRGFSASATCRATATTGAHTASTGWQAEMRIWEETAPNDGIAAGTYRTLNLSQAEFAVLGTLGPSQDNPMVWEEPDLNGVPPQQQIPARPPNDVFLFPKTETYDLDGDGARETTHQHRGYLTALGGTAGTSETSAAPRTVTAALNGALSITSAPMDPNLASSTVSVTLGRMNCESVDLRP